MKNMKAIVITGKRTTKHSKVTVTYLGPKPVEGFENFAFSSSATGIRLTLDADDGKTTHVDFFDQETLKGLAKTFYKSYALGFKP